MKKLKLTALIAGLLLLVAACQQQGIDKQNNGVTIHLNKDLSGGIAALRLQVVTNDIIRVSASPTKQFCKDTSLVVWPSDIKGATWDYSYDQEWLTLTTSNLSAKVSLKTGEVQFFDSKGNLKLQERIGGGKSISPVDVEGYSFYEVRQVFESPNDEAFFGLGQHQHGEMNYKGSDVELAQHNLVAVVPFIYSNKNFGLLWDNYSITRFGNPLPYTDIDKFILYNRDGEKGGITTTYTMNGKTHTQREEQTINYQFIDCFSHMPEGFDMGQGKVVWEGFIEPKATGEHRFLSYSAGYTKVWLNGVKVADNWRQTWNPWSVKFVMNLEAGTKYPLKIEWIPDQPESYTALLSLDPVDPAEQARLSLYSEVATQIDYYFINGNSADDVLSGYRDITGRAPIMPKWAMGLWQSRERYETQEDLLNVVKEYRHRGIPLDNIVLDWHYWEEDKWGSHGFETSRFPDPNGMVSKLHNELDARIMISVWPKFYEGVDNYNLMLENGWLYMKNVELQRRDWVGPGYVSTFYDAYNPEAGELFWNMLRDSIYVRGFDAWWLDATEPEIQSNTSFDERKSLMTPTYMGPGSRFYNTFSLVNSKTVYDGQRSVDPNKRVFILTRSGFAGQQRYAAATWSGDVVSRWDDLKYQISAGLNISIAGIPYWTMDIGGFSVEKRFEPPTGENLTEWRELNTRWHQYGAFTPLFRIHGQFPYREIYNLAPEGTPYYRSMVYYTKLRYRLMPYIYTLAGEAYHKNGTIMRPLVMDFVSDSKAINIGEQFMLGPSLLICPVYEYKARTKEVYLPATTGWYDFYSGKRYDGGQSVTVNAPIDRMPIFVREGAIVPIGPEIQHTNQPPAETINLFVYAGADGTFELYEDEDTCYSYEKGVYSIIPFSFNNSKRELVIGSRKGEYPGMLRGRVFRVTLVDKNNPGGYDAPRARTIDVKYTGDEIAVKL